MLWMRLEFRFCRWKNVTRVRDRFRLDEGCPIQIWVRFGKHKYNTLENQKAVSFRLDLKLIITSSGPVNRGVVYQLLRFLSCTWTLNWLFCNRSIWNRSWTLTALKIQKNPITVLNFILICIGIKVIYLYNEIFVFCNLESRSHCIISFLFKIKFQTLWRLVLPNGSVGGLNFFVFLA